MVINLKLIKKQAQKELNSVNNLEGLNAVSKKYLGKKGELTRILHSLERLSKTKRKRIGKSANELKNFLIKKIEEKGLSASDFLRHPGRKTQVRGYEFCGDPDAI